MSGLSLSEPHGKPVNRRYCLQRSLWRAALWGVLGVGIILLAIGALSTAALQNRNPVAVGTVVLTLVAFAAFIAQFLLPRVQVDVQGIHRRILWWWDCWPWEDFADGLVSQGVGLHSFRHPGKRIWAQRLELGVLEPEAGKEIDALIKRVWTPPAMPDCPDTLNIRVNRPGSFTITLTAEGVRYARRRNVEFSRWADLPLVWIWRLEHDRADFRELEFALENRYVYLRRNHEGQTWTGPSAEAISQFVLKHAERVEDYALLSDARTLEELEAKSERHIGAFEERLSQMRKCIGVFVAVLVALPLFFSWKLAIAMGALITLQGSIPLKRYRDCMTKLATTRADLERQRKALNLP